MALRWAVSLPVNQKVFRFAPFLWYSAPMSKFGDSENFMDFARILSVPFWFYRKIEHEPNSAPTFRHRNQQILRQKMEHKKNELEKG